MATRQNGSRPAESPWSVRIATVAGIPVRVHFTFFLILVWIALDSKGTGAAHAVLFVVSIFACVVLHELGHSLVARGFGIETRDITLYPIGGIATIKQRPKAAQELWIALAGPAVNVIIAGILLPVVVLTDGFRGLTADFGSHISIWDSLFVSNLVLATFNMIPAFPMDGGRVVRALLGLKMQDARATKIAAGIGQALAIGFMLFGLFTAQIILMLIAMFVFLGAGQEVTASISRSFVEGHTVSEAMLTQFFTVTNGFTLEEAAQMLLQGSQQDFPVLLGDQVLGLISRTDIARGMAQEGPTAYVSGHMRRDYRALAPHEPLEKALEMLGGEDKSALLVVVDERLIGMVTIENLSEFIMLAHARAQGRRAPVQ